MTGSFWKTLTSDLVSCVGTWTRLIAPTVIQIIWVYWVFDCILCAHIYSKHSSVPVILSVQHTSETTAVKSADSTWGRAAVCSLVPLTYEGTVEAYKAATCHYQAHPSFPTNKIHNYTLHITLIGPTEVIGNPWYCYHWLHYGFYSYLQSSQTRWLAPSRQTVNENTNRGNMMIGWVKSLLKYFLWLVSAHFGGR